MNPQTEATLTKVVAALKTGLGENLHSCCLYGSAVRGNAIEGVSDLNLLIVLNEATSDAHQAVAQAIAGADLIDPFVLGRRGFARSVRAFAAKFASIRRNHRILHGADPFAGISIDPQMEKFLCEQALRNLRLRLAYSFITRARHKKYDRFVAAHVTAVFIHLSEALRLEGSAIPADFSARIPLLVREFQVEDSVLRDLLDLRAKPRRFSDHDAVAFHARLFPVLDAALRWIEARWPA